MLKLTRGLAVYYPDQQMNHIYINIILYIVSTTAGVYRVLVGKPEEKKPLGRPRRRWEDNIMLDLQEVGCGGYGLDRAGSG